MNKLAQFIQLLWFQTIKIYLAKQLSLPSITRYERTQLVILLLYGFEGKLNETCNMKEKRLSMAYSFLFYYFRLDLNLIEITSQSLVQYWRQSFASLIFSYRVRSRVLTNDLRL